ncbi:hypothetical protein, partial [Vibrio sp. Vb2424]|uniref:hypothetical protein n=1 Tax=Vibrio sp. Vb2424 TaxID=2816074 RepID=UPI001A8FFEC1
MKIKKIFSAALIAVILPFAIPVTSQITSQKPLPPESKVLQGPQNPRLGFVIHGGAGVIKKGSLSPELEKE